MVSFVGGQHLVKFNEKVLAHGAISHFLVTLDAVAQLVNSSFLVHNFHIFNVPCSNSRSQSAVKRCEGGGAQRG